MDIFPRARGCRSRCSITLATAVPESRSREVISLADLPTSGPGEERSGPALLNDGGEFRHIVTLYNIRKSYFFYADGSIKCKTFSWFVIPAVALKREMLGLGRHRRDSSGNRLPACAAAKTVVNHRNDRLHARSYVCGIDRLAE